MPFKIVSTRRKGRVELSTVPSLWENKGKLRWPKRNGELLAKDENAQPRSDWLTFSCVLKRGNFLTYEDAEDELTRMLDRTDTDETDYGGKSPIQCSLPQVTDFNSMAQILISTGNSSEIQQISNSVIQAHGANSQIYDIIPEGLRQEIEELPTRQISGGNSSESQQLSSTINQARGINGRTYDVIAEGPREQMEENTAAPLDVCSLLVLVMQNQDKIMKKLGEISVQMSEIKDGTPFVTTLANAKGIQTKKIWMDPIDKVEDLEKLEKQLCNPEIYSNLMEKYSILCSVVSGSGTNCAYRLLDTLFTKDFLCKCSWTGGSRGADVKIGFKGFKNILKFFFEMVRSWDCTYTVQNNEDFFKSVLRNALKRKETKNIRTSSKKKRKTLNGNHDSNKNTNNDGEINISNEGEKNTNKERENNTYNIGNANDKSTDAKNIDESEEEDESLC